MRKLTRVEIITQNYFSPSSEYSRSEFVKIAKMLMPKKLTDEFVDKNPDKLNIYLVKAQGLVNGKLRNYGLVLKSQNYYNQFYVVKSRAAKKEIKRYRNTANSLSRKAETLTSGIEASQLLLEL